MDFRVLLMTAAVLIIGCGSSTEEVSVTGTDYVIRVEERGVTADELANVLSSAYGDSATIDQRTWAIVSKLLLLEDAVNRGLQTSDQYIEFKHRTTRGLLSAQWLNSVLESSVSVDPDTVDQVYAILGNTVVYTALTVSDSIQARDLRERVSGGENMRELAARFSTRSY